MDPPQLPAQNYEYDFGPPAIQHHSWFHDVGHRLLREGTKKPDASPPSVDLYGAASPDKPRDEDINMNAPFLVLVVTASYVIGILLYAPTFTSGPTPPTKYPTHKLFFWFGACSLIVNFYLFVTAFLVTQAQNRLLQILVSGLGLGEKGGITVCWIFCWIRVMQFFQEAFRIFSLEHDNVRTMQILYHILTGLVKPWVTLAATTEAMKPLVVIHSVFDIAISFYFSFEAQIAKYLQQKASDIEFYIIIFEIWQYVPTLKAIRFLFHPIDNCFFSGTCLCCTRLPFS